MKSLWSEPQDPNPAGALSGYVGAGAPLVAGFELAALVLLIVSPGVAADVPLVGPVMVAMVTSAALLVFSIRYGFWAVSYWTTPAERLMWDPAAVVADLPLQRQRRLLAGRMREFGKLRRRAEHLFQVGIFVFLVAVALLLVPDQWQASGTGWRWAAASVAGLAALVHLFWSAGNWRHNRNDRVYRRLKDRSTGPGDRPARRAARVARRDRRLVRCLVLLWPPARDAGIPVPDEPDGDSLTGLRWPAPAAEAQASGAAARPPASEQGQEQARTAAAAAGVAAEHTAAVTDLAAALDEPHRSGVELLGDPGPRRQHFRGPDGNVYQLAASESQATDLLATLVMLPGGERVAVATQRWVLPRWDGAADPVGVPRIWATKPGFVVNGRRSCAELAVLDRLRPEGWDGVWVSAVAGNWVRRDWFPTPAFHSLRDAAAPDWAAQVFDELRLAHGGLSGFFNVFAWRAPGDIQFIEVKMGSDPIQAGKRTFLQMALRYHRPEQFMIVEVA